MDSLKVFKGYDKVDDHNKHDNLEDQKQQQQQQNHQKFPITTKTHILIATISTITTLFLILTLSFSLINHHTTKTDSQTHLNSTESIQLICNVTRYPKSCITAISSSKQNPTDPKTILKLSLHASINELLNLSSSFSSNSKIHAFDDCKEQIDDAVSRLNDSVSVMSVDSDGAVTLTDERINDIQTWVSAALTDQETCVDGLEEVGSSVKDVDEVKRLMKRSSEYVSNSLAIVANLRTLLKQFHVTPLH